MIAASTRGDQHDPVRRVRAPRGPAGRVSDLDQLLRRRHRVDGFLFDRKHNPFAGWVFIADNLNTHQSESLVRNVAEACGIEASGRSMVSTTIAASRLSRR